jgi:formamidopyrimidine-DNA glycosylase
MPELPELEILQDELTAHVVGQRVVELVFPGGKGDNCPVPQWKAAMEGATIVEVERRGKMLVLQLDSGFSLIIHLMMVGQLVLSSLYQGEPGDVRLVLRLLDDQLFVGQVHLKFLRLVPTSEVGELPQIRKLGIDPLVGGLTAETLGEMLAERRVKVKSFLLDQRFVAGIGSTYADEMLFEARISPTRVASTLSAQEVRALHTSMVRTLERGLELGGSSEMAFVHLDGRKGRFQDHLQVKGRNAKPCFVCGTPIQKTSVGGRGTYFCPVCQS